MSRMVLGDSVEVMGKMPNGVIDFILTDPPYLVGFKDRSGREIANDISDEWLAPASKEMYRVLKANSLAVSFYGWNRVDKFVSAWKSAGFRIVGHLVFAKPYSSKATFVGYRHECAYLLGKVRISG
ncbi:DNA methyltransferase [Aeromonas hydrophila]|uniref:DNA methyltransferase n=1 Tax=Aeromonas hydrophila TaxID=644 RepID=UPI0031BBCD56